MNRTMIPLALLGFLLAAPLTSAHAQGNSDASVPSNPGRGKAYLKEQLQHLKEVAAFFNDPANAGTVTEADVKEYARIMMGYRMSGQQQRPGKPGKDKGSSMDGGECLGKSVALALEIYARKHPGNYNALRQRLQQGIPLNASQERTMHQFSDKLMEQIKPYFPTGGNGGNPRGRQGRNKQGGANERHNHTLPPICWELTFKSLGKLASMAVQYGEEIRG